MAVPAKVIGANPERIESIRDDEFA